METKICSRCFESKSLEVYGKGRTYCNKCASKATMLKRKQQPKLCRACGQEKPTTEFEKGKHLCTTCSPDPRTTGKKRCPTCKEVLGIDEFHQHDKSKDGLATKCKRCTATAHQTRKHAFDPSSIDMSQTKICSTCKVEKDFSEFYFKVGSRGGVNSECKECCKNKIYTYRELNPLIIKSTRRKHYEAYREQKLAYGSEYRRVHQEELNAYGRVYRLLHKEEYQKKDHQKYLNNRNRYKSYRDKRRVKLKGLPGTYTDKDIAAIWEQQQGLCVYCGADLTSVQENIDHYLPLDLDGTNWPSNLQLLCETCNKQKWSKHPDVYEAQIGFDRTAWEAKFGRCLSVSKTIHK